jgi:hypothetical protein
MSSLYVRKTRKSDADSTAASIVNLRSPATPAIFTQTAGKQEGRYKTTPSGTSSSEERTPSISGEPEEHEGGLGLAGPNGKNVRISEKDAEWVQNMKEKVRLASAEKERKQRDREEMESRRERAGFRDLDRVGGTKRLFKKG